MAYEIPISARAKRFGYLFWRAKENERMEKLLGSAKSIGIWFNNSYLGTKQIDWKYHRISIGYARTRDLDETVTQFRLSIRPDGALRIQCI